MTTIAYRDGVMAADTQSENDSWIVSQNVSKLVRLYDGAIVGFACDDTAVIIRFTEWYEFESGTQYTIRLDTYPDFRGASFNALLIQPGETGRLLNFGPRGYSVLPKDEPRAIGSGWPAARAAMYMGASARRAIEIAALLDPNTGGRVEDMWLELPNVKSAPEGSR